MSIMKKWKQFFSNHVETTDNHYDEQLRSRYYKTNTKQALQAVENVLKGMKGVSITSVSSERGEISASLSSPKQAFLVATIITVRPFETAVDFSVSTETPLPTDFGASKKIVLDLYRQLDKQLNFVGTGLSNQ